MKINREIRAERVRVITEDGEQLGVLTLREALMKAEERGLDLIEIAPQAVPPVCKLINYGKFKYHQTKKEKESKKAQHQVKIKEIKFKPNIDEHDLETKIKHAKEFLSKGNKVRVVCVFRGREMLHVKVGEKVIEKVCEELKDLSTVEVPIKLMGKMSSAVLAPVGKKTVKKKTQEEMNEESKKEN